MTTTTGDDLTTLRERRSSLADRLEDTRADQRGIAEELQTARTSWWHAIEIGDDPLLPSGRVHALEQELGDKGHASAHLEALIADLDTKIADVTARGQLADDVQRYHEARIDYSADMLPGLPGALTDAVEVVSAVLSELLAEVDTARTTHDQLLATAESLRMRADQLGVAVDAPEAPSWSQGLERVHHRDAVTRQLCLSLLQKRGEAAVLAEISRLILLERNAAQRAAAR